MQRLLVYRSMQGPNHSHYFTSERAHMSEESFTLKSFSEIRNLSVFSKFLLVTKFREKNKEITSENTRKHCYLSREIFSEYHSEFRDKFRDSSLNKIQRK
jgi:hypothetical protein